METFGRCGKGKGENSGLFQENFRFFSGRWFSMVLMRVYQAKAVTISGTDFHEVWRIASYFYQRIKKKSRRLPYVRSVYFKKDKIFLNIFWSHLFEKSWPDRMRRLKFLPVAIELLEKSPFDPLTKENPNEFGVLLHRFFGTTKNGISFCVQIKAEKSSNKKYLISIFPTD